MEVADYYKLGFHNQAETRRYVDTIVVAIGDMDLSGYTSGTVTDYQFAKRVVAEIEERFQGRVVVWPGLACRDANRSVSVVKDWILHTFGSIHKTGFPYLILVNGTKQFAIACLQAADILGADGQSVLVSNWWHDLEKENQDLHLDSNLSTDQSSGFQMDLLELVVNQLSREVVSLWK